MNSKKREPAFNDLLADLEDVVKQLESSDSSLENSLKSFETGINLLHAAQKLLSQAEQKVLLLTDSDNGPIATDLKVEDEQ